MTNTLENQEEDAQLFDVTKDYDEKLIPLINALIAACEIIGVQYVMSFCCAHIHDSEGCHYMCGAFGDIKPEMVSMQMQAAAQVLSMEDAEIDILAQVMNSIQPLIAQVKKETGAHLN